MRLGGGREKERRPLEEALIFLGTMPGWKAGHCCRPYLFWNPRAVGAVESRGHAILRTWRRNEGNGTSGADPWLESRVHGGEYADGLDRQRLWGGIRERNHLETDS